MRRKNVSMPSVPASAAAATSNDCSRAARSAMVDACDRMARNRSRLQIWHITDIRRSGASGKRSRTRASSASCSLCRCACCSASRACCSAVPHVLSILFLLRMRGCGMRDAGCADSRRLVASSPRRLVASRRDHTIECGIRVGCGSYGICSRLK